LKNVEVYRGRRRGFFFGGSSGLIERAKPDSQNPDAGARENVEKAPDNRVNYVPVCKVLILLRKKNENKFSWFT